MQEHAAWSQAYGQNLGHICRCAGPWPPVCVFRDLCGLGPKLVVRSFHRMQKAPQPTEYTISSAGLRAPCKCIAENEETVAH